MVRSAMAWQIIKKKLLVRRIPDAIKELLYQQNMNLMSNYIFFQLHSLKEGVFIPQNRFSDTGVFPPTMDVLFFMKSTRQISY